MAKNQIYVPQTGTIYPSASSAAAALGVDPSNIGKVLRGSRKSAGGYNFVPVTADVSADTLRWISEGIEQSLSTAQKRRQAKRRRSGWSRLSAEEKAAQRSRAKAARALQGQLSEANKLLAKYRAEGLDAVSGIVPELEKIKDIIGRNKKGGFNASAKNLAGFSERELQALTEALSKQVNRRGFTDLEEARRKKQAVAYQLGLGSAAELDRYAEALPALWHILDLARRQQGKGYDKSLYNAVSESMQAGMDPQQLKQVLDKMIAEQDGIDYVEDIEDPEERETEYSEIMQKYADMLYEDIDHPDEDGEHQEIDDILGDEWIVIA